MLSFYFVTQVPSGCNRGLDFGLVWLSLSNHRSEQYGCPKKNQIILLHVYLAEGETVAYAEGGLEQFRSR